MFPDVTTQTSPEIEYAQLEREFVGETRSQLSTLTGEIALRNRVIQENDAYVYDDLLIRMLDIPIGHDRTPVNWLRRTVEIHRSQMMGKGFTITSSYKEQADDDVNDPNQDPNVKAQVDLQNQHNQDDAEARRSICEAIQKDNNGDALWAQMAENASAIGTSVLKTYFDQDKKKYVLQQIEAVEHCYAIWSRDDFRSYDAFAYVYQVSKQVAMRDYNVGPNVATSPLGMPLAVLSSANIVEYISTQPMVTIMEVTGRVQGWKSKNGVLMRCDVGDETPLTATIVGDRVHDLVDTKKYMPHYYIFPNKRVRRRPWGIPDISRAAIQLNLTYIETLSDWRTNSSKINFPKWKGIGFGTGVQMPKPKPRTAEILPLNAGQDIQPLEVANGAMDSTKDFPEQLAEIKEGFVREVGISQVLFDNPDIDMNSKQAMNQAMGSISDLTDAKRQLWKPIILQVFEDAFTVLADWDDNIKRLAEAPDWELKISFPSPLQIEDPVYQTMLMNRLNTNTISLQTFLEKLGESKEELDRIKSEMDDKKLVVIHGKMMGTAAELAIMPPPSMAPPKVSVNLRGDVSPAQETNLSVMHGFGNGPIYGPDAGPQGQTGLKAIDNTVNQGMITNPSPSDDQLAEQYDTSGQPLPIQNPNVPQGQAGQPLPPGGVTPQQQQPDMQTTPANNTPGTQPVSMPGSGQPAPATSGQGSANKQAQRRGK